jgi:hypothetical protein
MDIPDFQNFSEQEMEEYLDLVPTILRENGCVVLPPGFSLEPVSGSPPFVPSPSEN